MVSSLQVACAAVPLAALAALGLARRWRARGRRVEGACLRGKTFVITGANVGIGLETARALVRRKARVILACRDLAKAKAAVADIRRAQPSGGELIPMQLDLASFASIENFVEIIKAGFYKIDVLINNAGVVVPLDQDMKTKEGFEIHFGVNHLGHFYLTNLLLDLLKRAAPSRIVVVTSTLHEKGKLEWEDLNLRGAVAAAARRTSARHNPAYSASKLCNAYWARALAERLRGAGVDVLACCPGFCYTSLFRHSIRWYHYILMFPVFLMFMKSAAQGAETVVYCATDYRLEGRSGGLYRDCAEYSSRYPFDREEQERLWRLSEEMVAARKPL